MKVKNSLDVNELPVGVELYCVYGPNCFPSIFSCVIRQHITGKCVWGYSVYKRVPGFRTIGHHIGDFLNRYKNAVFFDKQEYALEYLSKLITPKIKK